MRKKKTWLHSIYLKFMIKLFNSGAEVIQQCLEPVNPFTTEWSKFNAYFRNAIKDEEKVFCFWDNGASSCCAKFRMFRREFLSSVVNVLTNSVKISDPTIEDFVQLNLPRIHEKIG